MSIDVFLLMFVVGVLLTRSGQGHVALKPSSDEICEFAVCKERLM